MEPVSRDLVVPGDGLVVLIGPAGSGKSTLARAAFPEGVTLSSDDFRARLGRGEADQSVTAAAFGALNRALDHRLSAGMLTLVDATSLTRGARSGLIRLARRRDRPVIALVLDLPPELVLARNAARSGRVVPEPVVRRQLAMLAAVTDEALRREGFSAIRRLRSSRAVAALQVTVGQAGEDVVSVSTSGHAPGDEGDRDKGEGDANGMRSRDPFPEDGRRQDDRHDGIERGDHGGDR